jgi:two-component sensor histidine kinase
LQALGRAHDLLMQARWTSADLENIVRAATTPFDDPDAPKFSIAGPQIQITSGAVIALAMTLNELCTNTTKFGALSMPTGRVEVGWTVDDEMRSLRLRWTEKDGPVVHAPASRGFGTRLVETLGKQLKGVVLLTYEPSGFVFRLDVPFTSLTPVATDR